MITKKIICGILGVSFVYWGCSNPCAELAQKVCQCERDETTQQACLQRVDNAESDSTTTAADEECCSQLLKECTCERLAQGDQAACGLAQEDEAGRKAACTIRESLITP